MLDEELCRRVLNEAFPELDVGSVGFEGEGWAYELWRVNETTLFRFPKRAEVVPSLEKETRLLTRLAGMLSTPIPRPHLLSRGCRSFPLPFVGYCRLEGVPLSQAFLTLAARREVARGVGEFLAELHQVPAAVAEKAGVPRFTPESWRQHHVGFHERMHGQTYALLTAEERADAEVFWTEFLSDERMMRFEPVVVHGDLGPEHVLVDETEGAVAGVIDFEEAVVADPALDLAGFEEPFRRLVLEASGSPPDADLLARADSYRRMVPFHKVMFGVERGDDDLVRRGLEGIRRRVVVGQR